MDGCGRGEGVKPHVVQIVSRQEEMQFDIQALESQLKRNSSVCTYVCSCRCVGTEAYVQDKEISNDLIENFPFRLDDTCFHIPVCVPKSPNSTEICVYGNYTSSAEFYVFVGVMAFLYALGVLVLYVFWDELYQHNERVPIVVSNFKCSF